MARWKSCNVLKMAGSRQLWHFAAEHGDFKLAREAQPGAEEPLPGRLVGKTWRALWQKKLNIAWLPPGTAFLRAVQLPVSEPAEIISMVEFQLEKLSPLPVNQIVWSLEVLPHVVDNQQTVIVILAERQQVENYLGQLEQQSFVADRLEVPMLDQLLATEAGADGVWVYAPQEGTNSSWLVAAWQGGALRHLGLIQLPAENQREEVLKAHLKQMAWAGELEGWLQSEVSWHLVADTVSASLWGPVVREVASKDVVVDTPLPINRVAALTARRASLLNGAPGLIPADYAERYHAAFVDRIWMSGIGAIILAYMLGTLVYFGVVQILKVQVSNAEAKVASLNADYTKAGQLRAQIQILQDQQNFKYAALECWEATARYLPEGLTLTSLSLGRERTLTLFGVAPQDMSGKVTEFNGLMKKAEINGQPLFSKVNAPNMSGRSGGQITWNFLCEINRLERE